MKTILLVDDEFPARGLVKSMLNWDEAGFVVAYEAKNGAEALKLYQECKPDLIISDIQMPVMDGLALLSAIRRQDKAQLFIILSCFERFEYARQVIRLGGLDYLIKDTLTPDVLYAALQRAKEQLNARAEAVAPAVKAGEMALASPISQILEEWLRLGDAPRAAMHLKGVLPKPDPAYMLVSIGLEFTGEETFDAAELCESLQALPWFAEDCGCCAILSDRLLLFATLPHLAEDAARGVRYALLRKVQAALEVASNTPITLGASATHRNLDELGQARHESEDALRTRLFMGAGTILYYSSQQNTGQVIQARHLEARITSLRKALAQNDASAVGRELEKLYRKDLHGLPHLNYLEALNSILWGILLEEHMLREPVGTIPALLGQQIFEDICQMNSVEEMRRAFFSQLTSLIQCGERQPSGKYSQRIRHIMQYIEDKLEQDIGLDTIAENFQLHKAHLARVFKEEAGIGIHEFIRRQRIEAAKSLLMNSQYRVNEIIYLAGFKNPQNFYTLFMRHVGLTPKEYRDKYG